MGTWLRWIERPTGSELAESKTTVAFAADGVAWRVAFKVGMTDDDLWWSSHRSMNTTSQWIDWYDYINVISKFFSNWCNYESECQVFLIDQIIRSSLVLNDHLIRIEMIWSDCYRQTHGDQRIVHACFKVWSCLSLPVDRWRATNQSDESFCFALDSINCFVQTLLREIWPLSKTRLERKQHLVKMKCHLIWSVVDQCSILL